MWDVNKSLWMPGLEGVMLVQSINSLHVPGRSMHENIMTAFEIIHSIRFGAQDGT